MGKTQYALAHFSRPLLVRHLDDLGALDPAVHDGIVFDDVDFRHLPFSTRRNLVDFELRASVHIRYAVAWIPKQFRRIFTFNSANPLSSEQDLPAQADAIARRLDVVCVDKRLY